MSFLGWVKGGRPGPLLLSVGGLHGNEPAGVRALERVVELLRARRDQMAGDFVAVVGNRAALAAGRRFISYDLNRAWTPERVRDVELANSGPSANGLGASEDAEMLRLLASLAEIAERRRGPVFVLDIHTTSSGGGAFTTTADLPSNRHFAMEIPAPLVLGLDETVIGTLIGYLDEFGYTTAVFECGQHEEEEAAARAEAAIWLAIRAAGLLTGDDIPEARHGYEELREAYRDLPKVLEMRYRHPVEDNGSYLSRPGLLNFMHVQEGEVVGDDKAGEVVAPESGRILMPLYQEQGEDGFFVVRELLPEDERRQAVVLRRSGVGAGRLRMASGDSAP